VTLANLRVLDARRSRTSVGKQLHHETLHRAELERDKATQASILVIRVTTLRSAPHRADVVQISICVSGYPFLVSSRRTTKLDRGSIWDTNWSRMTTSNKNEKGFYDWSTFNIR